eukprot:5148469-Ditylum_brightwellii.AAC.1
MIGCYPDKKEGDDGLMWYTHTASQPPILHDGNMIRSYPDEKVGDDRLMQCTHTASCILIHDKILILQVEKRIREKQSKIPVKGVERR